MPLDDLLIAGVPLLIVIPACVEALKRAGMPVRFAGIAAVICGVILLALRDLTLSDSQTWATWIVGGTVYGLAAAGLYSQRDLLKPEPE
jgi:hypothetical protein